jgi:TPR repeat protein
LLYANGDGVEQNHAEALKWYRPAAEQGVAEAQYNLGGALASEGRRDEAVASFERAIEANPGYAEAHNNLGVLLQSEGREAPTQLSARHRASIDYAAPYNLGACFAAASSGRRSLT